MYHAVMPCVMQLCQGSPGIPIKGPRDPGVGSPRDLGLKDPDGFAWDPIAVPRNPWGSSWTPMGPREPNLIESMES